MKIQEGGRMVQTTVYLREQITEAVDKLAMERELSRNDIIREAVRLYLEEIPENEKR